MADGSSFYQPHSGTEYLPPLGEFGPPSIVSFLSGLSEDQRESLLFGKDDLYLLLNQSYIPHYMRDISSGPHDISNVAKPVSETRAKVNSIVYNDNLDVSFGGIERKTMDNILLLESIHEKFLKGEDMKHVEDCWYDIIEFLQKEYIFEVHNNMLKYFLKSKRMKTPGELRNLGLQIVERLLENETSKNT